MPFSNPHTPLLSYSFSGTGWHWAGTLEGAPADEAAERIRQVWANLVDWLPEHLSESVRSFVLLGDNELEIEIDKLRRPRNISKISGMTIRLRPSRPSRSGPDFPAAEGKNVPRPLAYRPLQERGNWTNPPLAPAQLLHRAITRVSHSAVTPREDANRAMRLSNLSFERDGRDILLVATDGHRLTLHRLVDFWKYISRLPETRAVVPVAELKNLLPRLKNAGDIHIDLSGHEGQPQTYSYGSRGIHTPALADAYSGSISVDGEEFSIPVVKQEFPGWRSVFPKPQWSVTVDSRTMLEVVSGLHSQWSAAMKGNAGRSARKEPAGRLIFEKEQFVLQITPDLPGTPETFSGTLVSSGLTQSRPVRFYMNLRYLKEALRVLDGPVVIAGENEGAKAADGNSYLVRPVTFLVPQGPTEILIMPMYPPG